MGRQARQYSKTGLYHIVFRGMNRQNIFEQESDYKEMIDIIINLKQEMKFNIYAYCLMSNHVHLLLKEQNTGDISIIMKRLLTKYVGWFNRKYSRVGSLIANRYKSQPIEFDKYLLSVLRYIHQNPLKAGMTTKLSEYKWSSYLEYINGGILIDVQFILEIIDKNSFIIFHNEEEKELYEVSDKIRKSDEYIKKRIVEITGVKQPQEIGILPKIDRNIIIKRLRIDEGFSIRQIERVTGISRGVIANVDI